MQCRVPVLADLDDGHAPVTGATGTRDLYLRFAGGTGCLLNVNWWQFGTGGGGGNVLVNGDLEGGTNGWAAFGAGTLSSNTSVVHGGTRSLLYTGRTASWNGVSQNVTSVLTNGKNYATSVWVRTQSGTPQREGDACPDRQRFDQLPFADPGGGGEPDRLDAVDRHGDGVVDRDVDQRHVDGGDSRTATTWTICVVPMTSRPGPGVSLPRRAQRGLQVEHTAWLT